MYSIKSQATDSAAFSFPPADTAQDTMVEDIQDTLEIAEPFFFPAMAPNGKVKVAYRGRKQQNDPVPTPNNADYAPVTLFAPPFFIKHLARLTQILKGVQVALPNGKSFVIGPDHTQGQQPVNLNVLTLLSCTEPVNTSGIIGHYADLENFYQNIPFPLILSFKDWVRECVMVSRVTIIGYGGYGSSARQPLTPNVTAYICHSIGLQFQQPYNTGYQLIFHSDNRERIRAEFSAELFEALVGEKPPTTAQCKEKLERFEPFHDGYIDRVAYQRIIAQDFIKFILSVNQAVKADENYLICAKFLQQGAGCFAGIFGSFIRKNIGLGIKLGLQLLFHDYPSEAYECIRAFEFPFCSEKVGSLNLGAEIRSIIQSHSEKLGHPLECFFGTDDCLKPRILKDGTVLTTATTDCADPHVVAGNEMGHQSVDASVGENVKYYMNQFSPVCNPHISEQILSVKPAQTLFETPIESIAMTDTTPATAYPTSTARKSVVADTILPLTQADLWALYEAAEKNIIQNEPRDPTMQVQGFRHTPEHPPLANDSRIHLALQQLFNHVYNGSSYFKFSEIKSADPNVRYQLLVAADMAMRITNTIHKHRKIVKIDSMPIAATQPADPSLTVSIVASPHVLGWMRTFSYEFNYSHFVWQDGTPCKTLTQRDNVCDLLVLTCNQSSNDLNADPELYSNLNEEGLSRYKVMALSCLQIAKRSTPTSFSSSFTVPHYVCRQLALSLTDLDNLFIANREEPDQFSKLFYNQYLNFDQRSEEFYQGPHTIETWEGEIWTYQVDTDYQSNEIDATNQITRTQALQLPDGRYFDVYAYQKYLYKFIEHIVVAVNHQAVADQTVEHPFGVVLKLAFNAEYVKLPASLTPYAQHIVSDGLCAAFFKLFADDAEQTLKTIVGIELPTGLLTAAATVRMQEICRKFGRTLSELHAENLLSMPAIAQSTQPLAPALVYFAGRHLIPGCKAAQDAFSVLAQPEIVDETVFNFAANLADFQRAFYNIENFELKAFCSITFREATDEIVRNLDVVDVGKIAQAPLQSEDPIPVEDPPSVAHSSQIGRSETPSPEAFLREQNCLAFFTQFIHMESLKQLSGNKSAFPKGIQEMQAFLCAVDLIRSLVPSAIYAYLQDQALERLAVRQSIGQKFINKLWSDEQGPRKTAFYEAVVKSANIVTLCDWIRENLSSTFAFLTVAEKTFCQRLLTRLTIIEPYSVQPEVQEVQEVQAAGTGIEADAAETGGEADVAACLEGAAAEDTDEMRFFYEAVDELPDPRRSPSMIFSPIAAETAVQAPTNDERRIDDCVL